MTTYVFLSILAFLLYLQANIYLLRVMPGSTIKTLFSLKLFALSWVSLFITLSHFTDQVRIVYKLDMISIFGWLSFPILISLFFYKNSGTTSKVIETLVKYILTPIALAILIRYLYQPETLKQYYQGASGIWYFKTNVNSFWTNLSTFYLFTNSTIVIYSFVKWFKSVKKGSLRKENIKTGIIFISLLIFISISLLTHIFLPGLGSPAIPPMVHISAIPLMAGLFLTTVLMHPNAYYNEMISQIFINRIKEFVFYLDHNEMIYSINQFTIDNLGYSVSEISKQPPDNLFKPKAIIKELLMNAAINKKTKPTTCFLLTKSGNPIPVSVSVSKVYDAFNNMVGFLIVATDSSQVIALEEEYNKRLRIERKLQDMNVQLNKRIELRLKALIKSKQKLNDEHSRHKTTEERIKKEIAKKGEIIREIYHRVKNNIQMIVSLINMERNKPQTKMETKKILAGITSRILDISQIHDYLYDSPYMGKIQFNHFIIKTIRDLKANHKNKEEVYFNVSVSKDDICIDQAIPCGIIFYELINNALQYASVSEPSVIAVSRDNDFSAERLIINIEFYKERERFYLSVKDNGKGITLINNVPAQKKIGLTLVETLVNDYLNGEIGYNASNGTSINISFLPQNMKTQQNQNSAINHKGH